MVWQNLLLQVKPYMKDGRHRGSVITEIDGLMETLDDSALSLQSMAASRFVAPFLSTVHKLEQALSYASEVLELWVVVQRKWLYLESIFLSGDIRTQLPKEAETFTVFDKLFQKVRCTISNRSHLSALFRPDP